MAVHRGLLSGQVRHRDHPSYRLHNIALQDPAIHKWDTSAPSFPPGWIQLHRCWPPEGMCTAGTGLCAQGSSPSLLAEGMKGFCVLGHPWPWLRVCNASEEERKTAKEKQKLPTRRKSIVVRSSGQSPKAPKATRSREHP